jgi:citrate synthase
LDFKERYGENWVEDNIHEFVDITMAAGRVIPGYGHAVLRQTDPRYICQ